MIDKQVKESVFHKDYVDFIDKEYRKRNLKYGNQDILPLYAPVILEREDRMIIKEQVKNISEALNIILNHKYYNFDLQKIVSIIGEEGLELIKNEDTEIISRYDCYYDKQSKELRILEFNCSDPSGAGYSDAIREILTETYKNDEVLSKLEIDSICAGIGTALKNRYKDYCKKMTLTHKENPFIVFVQWDESPVWNDFELITDFLSKRGYKTAHCTPQNLVFDNNKIFYNKYKVDIIYRDCLDELIKPEYTSYSPQILKSYLNKEVFLVNPIKGIYTGNKTLLKDLSIGKYNQILPQHCIDSIEKTIPWTREINDVSMEQKTIYNGS